MSLEEFRQINASDIPLGKLISMIARGQNIYLNHNLKKLDINSSQLHLLFEISHQSNLNQEKIASRCNINKGSVARSIKKLEEKELIIRQIDEKNRRQNKVSLTPAGEDIMKKGIDILYRWEEEVFQDNIIDENTFKKALKEVAINSIEIMKENNE